ncbi:TMV resistance protein N-like [Rhodamnia argentea]|uniref:TMV resistance protein N-like n=1 Tax=Rhodamnia argentea TaxID=178133 RepID=A0A8B8PZW0_9MYRT|nr:TMV resistance protein N-like [Rhodamnia argentea]
MATSEEQFEYDVFLSYNRSERDAGSFFPQHLHDVLNQNGIKSYKYSEDLEQGEEIAPAVVEAIKASRIFVVILSRRYASSASCLSELVKILEQDNLIGKRVMPLFYGVEPACVRRQRESYHEAMAEHESRYGSGSDKVRRWREALGEVGELRGWILPLNQGEAESIQRVAEDIGITLQQLNAPTALEASPTSPKWAGVIWKLTVGAPLIFALPLLMVASGGVRELPIGVVIFAVSFCAFVYLVFATIILHSSKGQNTA